MNVKLMAGISAALVMAGCASAPTINPALENARNMVNSAEADPRVAQYDALDLEAAKNELKAAEDAWMHHDQAGVEQPAYMAAQTARLAELKATAKADDARVAAGQIERDRIQLNARTREVNAAQNQAEMAKSQADMAKSEADMANAARDQATQKAAALQAEVDALKAKPTDRGLVLTLGDVLFDTGRAELNPGASRKLDQLAQFLTEHPDRHLEIDGYTDSVGTDGYNQQLSQERADSVKSALVTRGIDPLRIVTRGYGKDFAVASNSDAAGRQLNRRVEVVIGDDTGAPVAARGRY